jgi:hypothetical protein
MQRASFALFVLLLATSATAQPSIRTDDSFRAGGPATTDNDASCDISELPAATLLLPYFEVDIDRPLGIGENTILTITNVSQLPQATRVTLWTDLAFPVLSFNIYLTGYDVQSINLYDVIGRGLIAPTEGTGSDVSPVGDYSGPGGSNWSYDNPLVIEESCVDLPVQLSPIYVTRMQHAFTQGKIPSAPGTGAACATAGGVHANAVGYVTIDVTDRCGTSMPTDVDYWAYDILFDNVLVGDYLQINGDEDFAQGSSMVHIRAIPEGGSIRDRLADDVNYRVNSPQTFYGRYQHAARPRFDARQPLPTVFAARWIEGGASGFETFYKTWRESRDTSGVCANYRKNYMKVLEVVRFDEEENPTIQYDECGVLCLETDILLRAASLTSAGDYSIYPPNHEGAVAGWMYVNLDENSGDLQATQGWVVSSMRSEGRYSVDIDAKALGNGCSKSIREKEYGVDEIGPLPNKRVD